MENLAAQETMGGTEVAAGHYRIDAGRSRFVVRAEATGLLSVFGHNPMVAICGFGGDAHFAPDAIRQASLLMLVQSNSLAAVGEASEKDRHEIGRVIREEVLESARYPEIIFMSKGIEASRRAEGKFQASIRGNLSLRGVTREQLIEAQVTVNGDGLTLRAQGEFRVRQSSYGIKAVSALGGTLKVKDELRLSFDIIARQSST